MSNITFVGLGLMGAAIALRAQQDDQDMTVWNRSPEKMQPFVERGAQSANSIQDAVASSPILVICIEDYGITRAILDVDEVRSALQDRIVIQLSTGTPRDAVESETWFRSQGARYIDGAILGGPGNLNTENARILFAGPEDAFAEAEESLKSLCYNIQYVGDNIRAAAALDLGWLCRHYGMFLGMGHAAVLCESEEVGLDLLAGVIPESEYAHHYIQKVADGNYTDTTATLDTWATAFESISRQAMDAGINDELPQLMSSLFDRARKAGLGDEDITALVKVLRKH
ncbi:MAG: NAD(P)-binding domain-containing protein [Gammaproteobacteria bacterium]|nr:NAD(P)-binding domain-containing protein [Gammaproteobacteria bacterium]